MHKLIRARRNGLFRNRYCYVQCASPRILPKLKFQRFNSSKVERDGDEEIDKHGQEDDMSKEFDEMIFKSVDVISEPLKSSKIVSKVVQTHLENDIHGGNVKTVEQKEANLYKNRTPNIVNEKIVNNQLNEKNHRIAEHDEDFQLLNSFLSEYSDDKLQIDEEKNSIVDFDNILNSLNIRNDTPTLEDFDSLTNLTSENLKKSNLRQFDVDRDETIFDYDFLANSDEKKLTLSKFLDSELSLFQDIFENHLDPETKREDELKLKSWDVQDSLLLTSDQLDNFVQQSKVKVNKISKVSLEFRYQMFERTKVALSPTLEFISSMNNPTELVDLFNQISTTWENDRFYLIDEINNSSEITEVHIKLMETIHKSSKKTPNSPFLNILTLPTIFNQIIETTAYKFYDGQLALSLFNILKRDVRLYTFACNQETFNQVLKLYWIFNGKSSLYNIEMIYLEMINNGFNGDVTTFNILKQIVIDYYKLKMGTSIINESSKLPIWCKEDDKRAYSLEHKLFQLASRLRSEGFNRESIPIPSPLQN
jgi:hypothetical protein